MSINIARNINLNEASSNATRALLVESTIDLLIKVGFTKTTGVAVCRRAGLTRGALNHHFPVFSELFVETLQTIYWRLLDVHFDKDASL
ncbi:MAG: AcrR family transcriptional regulator, partial [Halioglobus sp.]